MAKLSLTADVVALSAGGLLLAALAGTLLTTGAAAHPPLMDGRHQHLMQGLVGITLVLWPVVRRLVREMCRPGDAVEFAEMAHSLRRMGLSNRVKTVNLYLGEQADDAWRTIFATRQELWDWLGEAYRDPELRAQMHPKVAKRTAAAGHPVALPGKTSVAG